MQPWKLFCKKLTETKLFEFFIAIVILVNSVLIGIETYFTNHTIYISQSVILAVFTIEIVMRWFACSSNKSFWQSGWNIFDFVIVFVAYIPESLFANGGFIIAIRILRVFRVLRLLRAFKELKIITTVLLHSCKSLFYTAIFFVVFIYLYSIIGTTLFKLPDINTADERTKKVLLEYYEKVPNSPEFAPPPYQTLGETSFTLFRILTGEDWTDLRYSLLLASKLKLIKVPPIVVTFYHVSWFVISAFLLLNLLVGAVVNNYDLVMRKQKI